MAEKAKMVTLRNVNSGAVVSVRADKTGLDPSEWEPFDGSTARSPAKKAAPRKRAPARKKAAAKKAAPVAAQEPVAVTETDDD